MYWNQVAGQSMVWDPVFDRMVAWGGGGGCYFADPSVIVMAPYQGDPTTFSYGTFSLGGAPTPRTDHTAIYDAANQRMILFGGQFTNDFEPCTPLYTNQTFTLPLVDWNLGYTSFTLVPGCGSDPGLTSNAKPNDGSISLRLVGQNPIAGSAQFAFVTPASGHVDLKVFDLLGRQVATLADGEVEAGQHSAKWDGYTRDGHRASQGVYFVRLRHGAEVREQRLILQP
jgi:hypothetical protein